MLISMSLFPSLTYGISIVSEVGLYGICHTFSADWRRYSVGLLGLCRLEKPCLSLHELVVYVATNEEFNPVGLVTDPSLE